MQGSKHPALHASDLRKRYGAVTALDGLSLEIASGEIYGLLGPNGAGKTTALRIVCGLLRPDSGEGSCLGGRLGEKPDGLGYMPQRGGLYDDLSVSENLRFFARAHGVADLRSKVVDALAEFQLVTRAAQRVGTLSGGWRQRVALAATLLHEPRLLLLDEPSAGLDPLAREALWAKLRARATGGVTVLVTTHYADEAERCDRIGYLDEGRLRIEGAPDGIALQLGISVWRIAADSATPPSEGTAHVVRDAAGWRVIVPASDSRSPEFGAWAGTAKAEVPRLADALSWLAAHRRAST